ncbi:MAG: glutamate formimidoyltransferase [Acholeplasmataceae bacterium]|nr:glutamate formimidoyltransferase [Acholeplasmataceae bacterium]
MKQIVQCVPNFSEGRDLEKIHRITEPLKHHDAFKCISIESDKDYNRTVVTLLGDPAAMIEPLLAFFGLAEKLIDMNIHQGEHSRMGAVDVVPFIPISDINMEACVAYAKDLGKQVSKLFDVPVYLYAKAAKDASRENLPDIRKGEFEGMKEKIKDPFWIPDYGKAEVHPTFGVVAMGARMPLIAYNIDLDTTDEKIANQIAKAIRKSSGGFQHVQAGPVFLKERGHVQVTMNILDYKKNPMYRIFETVVSEAKRYHVQVTGSEVVGLIPMEALSETLNYYQSVHQKEISKDMNLKQIAEQAIKYLMLRDFDELKIIEANL